MVEDCAVVSWVDPVRYLSTRQYARLVDEWVTAIGLRGHRGVVSAPASIVMTSLVFTLGIVPLVIAKGLSSDTQNALGTGLFCGMISATILAVLRACLLHAHHATC